MFRPDRMGTNSSRRLHRALPVWIERCELTYPVSEVRLPALNDLFSPDAGNVLSPLGTNAPTVLLEGRPLQSPERNFVAEAGARNGGARSRSLPHARSDTVNSWDKNRAASQRVDMRRNSCASD